MTTTAAPQTATAMGKALTEAGFAIDQYPTDDSDPRSNIAIDITRDDVASVTAQVVVTPEGGIVEGWVAALDAEGKHFAASSGFLFLDDEQLASTEAFLAAVNRVFG